MRSLMAPRAPSIAALALVLPALAGGAALFPAAPVRAQTAAPAPTTTLEVSTGQGRLVTLNAPMSDVFVANDAIADVQVRSPTQLYIFGKAAGETSLYATTRSGTVLYSTNIRVGNNITSIDGMLRLAMPDADITATPMNGMILLTGTVASPDDTAEAERLVRAYIGEGPTIVSRLRNATPLQVNLQVRFAEVSRDFVKNIGVNLLTSDTTSGFQFGISSGRTAGTITGSGSSAQFTFTPGPEHSTLGLAGNLLGLDILSAIDLGEETGQVTTLASPNLTAISGETATFLAGGEIPIPVSQGLGAVSVEYKQYGVSLAYTPTVLSDGRISLRVRPEVSQLSSAGAVTISGTTIPALTTRRAETTVELGSGQSFMIAGLLSNTQNNRINRAPGLGDLPIIGALFRSNAFERNETELVIIITPYLVRPMNAGQAALPTDGQRTPSDLERIVGGQVNGAGAVPHAVPTLAPTITEPAAQPAPRSNDSSRRNRRSERRGSDATPAPGFSAE